MRFRSDSASPFLWRSFRFLAAGNFPNTPTPRGGGTKKIRISHFAKACVMLGARSLNPPILLPVGDARDGLESAGTELCRSPRSPPGHDLRLDEHFRFPMSGRICWDSACLTSR